MGCENENDVKDRKKLIEKYCEYGLQYFCDGTPNKSELNYAAQRKPPCKYFRNHCPIKSPIYRNMMQNQKRRKSK